MNHFRIIGLTAVLTLVAVSAFAADAAPAAAPAPAAPAAAAPAAPAAPVILQVGSMSDIKVLDPAQGKEVAIQSVGNSAKKKVVVFMNTSCSACRSEVDMVDKFLKKNSDLKGELVGIASDMGKFDNVLGLKANMRWGGVWLHDPEFRVPPRFGFNFAPAMVVIGTDGKVLLSKAGFDPDAVPKIQAELSDLLK